MFYYFDHVNYCIVEMSAQEVIFKFAEQTTTPLGVQPKFFYSDDQILSWEPNGRTSYIRNCAEYESEELLVSWAIEDALNLDQPVHIFQTKQQVLDFIQKDIENESMWDMDSQHDVSTIEKLKTFLKDNQSK